MTVAEGAGKASRRRRAMRATARWPGWPRTRRAAGAAGASPGRSGRDRAAAPVARHRAGGHGRMAPLSRRDEVDLRPWLDQDRDDILRACAAFEAATGWRAVQDPTNSDPHYTRAALRELLAPALDARWPGWRGIVARHARTWPRPRRSWTKWRARISPRWSRARTAPAFAARVARAVAARQAQVLRWWLDANGARMPSEAHARPAAPAARPAQPGP